jgi:hypothetical protein
VGGEGGGEDAGCCGAGFWHGNGAREGDVVDVGECYCLGFGEGCSVCVVNGRGVLWWWFVAREVETLGAGYWDAVFSVGFVFC